MSTQYGTLSHHKTVQVPMWLIVALVVGMLAIAVGYTVEQYQGRGAVATSTVATFPDTQVAAREGGAVFPATADARCSPAAWRRPVSSPSPPRTASAVFPGGLETSGVIPVTAHAPEPIVVNGQICHQCL